MLSDFEKQLLSEDIETRRQTVLTLAEVPDGGSREGYIKLLLTGMMDSSWRVRKTAVDVLMSNYPLDSFIEGVIKLLYVEDNAGARNSSVEVLTKLQSKATEYLIEAFKTDNYDVRKFIIDIVGDVKDKRSVSMLVEALTDEDENVKAAAVEHLGTMKETSVVDHLIDILQGGDLWTAYPAVEALGKIGDQKAVPVLLDALTKKTLREPAIRALGYLANPDTIKHVVPFIEDMSKAVQNEALSSIEKFYHGGINEDTIVDELRKQFGERLTEILLEHATSSRKDVKVSAIMLLGLLKDETVMTPLVRLAAEGDYEADIKKALIYIGKHQPESLLQLFDQGSAVNMRFVCEVAAEVASPVYFDSFAEMLLSDDGHVRSIATEGLANIGDIRAIERIKNLLIDPYEDVQEAAVASLARFKDGIKVKEMLYTLKSDNPVLRKNAALMLGRVGASDALDALGFALKDNEVSVRRAVVMALSGIKGDEVFGYFSTALGDEDSGVRSVAAMAVGEVGGPVAARELALLLNDSDDMVKVSAVRALGNNGDPEIVELLTPMLFTQNGFVVTTAIEAIGKVGGDEAREALRSTLISSDPEFVRTTIDAMAGLRNVEHLLLPFVENEDWAVRVAAVRALMDNHSADVKHMIETRYDIEEDQNVKDALKEYIKKC